MNENVLISILVIVGASHNNNAYQTQMGVHKQHTPPGR